MLIGLIAIGIWAGSYVRRAAYQTWANHQLNHQSATPPERPSVPPLRPAAPLQNGALIGRLAIPRLNVRAIVREGTGEDTLDVALGHVPGTALPGERGNTAIAGHRDTLFRALRKIATNDLIEFQAANGTYNYRVESTRIVKPDNVSVLKANDYPEITLVTCYPFYYVGSAPDRFIVKARLVDVPITAAPTQSVRIPAPQPDQPPARPKAAAGSWPSPAAVRRVGFQLNRSRSRELIPGIRLGVVTTDAARHRASVWMYMTPERRTISLKNQPVHQPVFFHGHNDGKQRALMITRVNANSVSGYLLLYGNSRKYGTTRAE